MWLSPMQRKWNVEKSVAKKVVKKEKKAIRAALFIWGLNRLPVY